MEIVLPKKVTYTNEEFIYTNFDYQETPLNIAIYVIVNPLPQHSLTVASRASVSKGIMLGLILRIYI